MKSMEYYIKSEAENYSKILNDYQQLMDKLVEKYKSNKDKYSSIVLFATGSSSNAAYGAVPYMTERLGIPVYVEEPSIAANYHSNFRDDILYIAISQGGHSASTIKVVKELVDKNIDVFVFTSDLESPIAKTNASMISMGFGIEEMPYVTLGYSITILLLILFAAEASYQTGTISKELYEEDKKELGIIADNLPSVVNLAEEWTKQYLEQNTDIERLFFIGYGAAYGVAREGETKVTETDHITAQGKELEEYMHGPYIGLHNSDHFIFIEPQGKLEERSQKLAKFLRLHSDHITVIAKNKVLNPKDEVLDLKINVNELFAALFMTIPVHLLAFKLSKVVNNNLEVITYPEFDEITASKI